MTTELHHTGFGPKARHAQHRIAETARDKDIAQATQQACRALMASLRAAGIATDSLPVALNADTARPEQALADWIRRQSDLGTPPKLTDLRDRLQLTLRRWEVDQWD